MVKKYYIDYQKLSDLEKELKVSMSVESGELYVLPLRSFDSLMDMVNVLLYQNETSNSELTFESLKKMDILKEVTE